MSRRIVPAGGRAMASAVAALALTLAVVAGSAVAASPTHPLITRGDVTAAFQARTTGGFLNLQRGHLIAAPVRGLMDGRISSFGDRTYCSRDWHYIGVSLLAEGGRAAATRYLDGVRISYAIDGTAVRSTMRTAIKPFVGTGVHGQYGVSVGKLIGPGSLAPGEHTLETWIATPDGGIEPLAVTFSLTLDACG
jgi:hypothetical protein